jgi:hypothetical protein
MVCTGFIEAPHPGTRIAFWEKAASEGRPHAAENLITKLTLISYSGNADACEELGKIYLEGKLVPRDPAASARWYARARELASSPNGMNASSPGPLNPELMAKMQVLLKHAGKDIDINPTLSARLGLTREDEAWACRQVAGTVKMQPGYLHSFSISRDGADPDLLLGLRTPTQLYIFRSNRDGAVVDGGAIVTDNRTGQSVVLDRQDAQARLNQEFTFWAEIINQLLATIPRANST